MSNHSTPIRPAMTALAAVIALSSTSLLAQATDTTQAAPVVVAPPAPDVSAPPAVAQTATPDVTAAPVASAPVEAAPAPAMRTMSTPVEHMVAEASDARTAPTRSAPVVRTVVRSAAATATPAVAKPAPVEAQRTITPAPVEAPAPVATTPAPVAAPVATTTQTTRQQSVENEALPIAGIVGLGVLAVGGAAFALRRKRREDDDEELLLEEESLVAPAPVATPVAVAARAAPARTRSAKTLPNGFDISRFGRHTQAAYMGPTKDNPSLSLKRRLKRASFFDQREREAAAGTTRKLAEPVYPAVARAEKDNGQVTIRMTPPPKGSRNGYVLQK